MFPSVRPKADPLDEMRKLARVIQADAYVHGHVERLVRLYAIWALDPGPVFLFQVGHIVRVFRVVDLFK